MKTRRLLQAAAMTGAVLATAPVTSRAEGYDGQTFHPSHDGSGAFTTYGGEPLELWNVHAGLWLDHSTNPIVLQTEDGTFTTLAERQTQYEVGAMVGLPLDMEAGFALPYLTQQMVNPLAADGGNGVNATGIGDVRLIGKWTAFRSTNDWVPQIGAVAELALPTGDEESWHGAGHYRPSLLVVGQQNLGPVALIGNLGYRLRTAPEDKVWGVAVDDEMIYKVGGVVNTGLYDVDVLAEINGASSTVGGPNPLEVGMGLRRSIWGGSSATIGVNRGVTESLGTPRWRYFLGINWLWGGKNLKSVTDRPAPILAAATPTPAPTPVARVPLNNPNPTPKPVATMKPAPTPTPAPVARVTEKTIEINQTIHFRKNSAVIEDSSYPILDLVVAQLKAHPEIVKISIEGHTDSTGNALFNLYLSKVRANSVRNYMTNKGVEPGRLSTSGWGHEKPMADNRTTEGRQMNRRVEFKIEKRRDPAKDPPK